MRIVIEDPIGPGARVLAVKREWGDIHVINESNLEKLSELSSVTALDLDSGRLDSLMKKKGNIIFNGSYEEFLKWLTRYMDAEIEDLPRGIVMKVRDWLRLVQSSPLPA